MVRILTNDPTSKVVISGFGIIANARFELAPGIALMQSAPDINLDATTSNFQSFFDYAACVTGQNIASFSIEISGTTGSELAVKAWNSLWLFHLLSIACSCPCYPLYAMSCGDTQEFTATNRNLIFKEASEPIHVQNDSLELARSQAQAFQLMISDPSFAAAMRCYGNSHYLFDLDMRIMLLWAGIEGLLSVDSELSRRIALYAALLHEGSTEEKVVYFNYVRTAYGIRSRAVHGGITKPERLSHGYQSASKILAELLRRCVELRRIPKPLELDALAVSQRVEA